MSEIPIDDGSAKPLGFQTEDGELEVRESVDNSGAVVRGFHETELGQHQRWMRQAPDLFERYQVAVEELARLRAKVKKLETGARLRRVDEGGW